MNARVIQSGREKRARGSVLVIVLVTLLFVSTALLVFMERAGDDLIVEAREATARRLRLEAYSALDVTLAVLENFRAVNGGLRSPAEGWDDPLGFAGWTPSEGRTVEITFEDESSKLSLPQADAATLMRLFESWEMPQADAERLVDALLGWMRKDYVPTTSRMPDYEQGQLPYVPPERPLRSYQELAAIDYARDVFYDRDGRPNDLWQRFVSATSLYDFKQSNVNGGQPDVLAAFGIDDPLQQRRVRDYLSGTGERAYSGPGYFESPAEMAALVGSGAVPQNVGTEISALRINLVVREGRSEFRVSTVVAPPGGAKPVGPSTVDSEQSTEEQPEQQRTEQPARETTGSNAGAAGSGQAKKLRYPFTLLEIRENDENSAVPSAPTNA